MEPFRIEHADGGVTTIKPMNKDAWSVEREGGPRAHGRAQTKAGEITSSLRTDELVRFGEWLTRLANPDIPQVQAQAAAFGVHLMQREYEQARTLAEDLRALAHYAELADKTLEHVTDALNAAEQAESDAAEISGGPLGRRIVDVLRACTGTMTAKGIAERLGVEPSAVSLGLGTLKKAEIVTLDSDEAPPRYGIAEGWR